MCPINILNHTTMKNENKNLSAEESLSLISEMINSVKGEFRQNAFYFLLWGWTIALSCLVHYTLIMIFIRLEMCDKINLFSFINWAVFVSIGMVIQYSHALKKPVQTKSHYNRFLRIIWQVSGLTMVLSVFIALKFSFYPIPLILLITGLATLTSGIIIRFKPLILGGILFFIAAMVATYLLYEQSLLVCALAIALGYLVPGYILRNSKSNSDVQGS